MQCHGHELLVKIHYTFKNNFFPNIVLNQDSLRQVSFDSGQLITLKEERKQRCQDKKSKAKCTPDKVRTNKERSPGKNLAPSL